ncbi:MAG: hypothetical protein CM15mV117_140 [Caudoviricetes sp.]|nr:MAG: hypothetical protein CM15mV117_140 [Caudoviricetes sp.]
MIALKNKVTSLWSGSQERGPGGQDIFLQIWKKKETPYPQGFKKTKKKRRG